MCVGFPYICVCRISRASGVPLFTYFHQIHTSHYLPDYLHLIIQACHYLPIPALITGSVSIQSNSDIYALQSHFTCTICALLQLYSTICALHALNVFYMHYMRHARFCCCVQRACKWRQLWRVQRRAGGNYQQRQLNLIRIKADP